MTQSYPVCAVVYQLHNQFNMHAVIIGLLIFSLYLPQLSANHLVMEVPTQAFTYSRETLLQISECVKQHKSLCQIPLDAFHTICLLDLLSVKRTQRGTKAGVKYARTNRNLPSLQSKVPMVFHCSPSTASLLRLQPPMEL